jgi:phosphate transport system permease protein
MTTSLITATGPQGRRRSRRRMRETVILGLLIAAASVAVLTTLGIVLSMVFETGAFLQLHSWRDFLFGLSWAPNFRGDSSLSILPLLWGTIYISLVALAVAVPIGLMAAIYLAEYAGPKTRGIAKPLLEILAGIPTIVYGLFALTIVGPMLVSAFGQGGFLKVSLGLGATPSETIRRVVLPAALPGIVGAILLAASRAIGETMIVVMGAGAVARFSINPLEGMTTITTRIVAQLTGDGDFASPETLVAFALGLALFVLTLGLNIVALLIVRRYREQYE